MEPQCHYCRLVDKHRCGDQRQAERCSYYLREQAAMKPTSYDQQMAEKFSQNRKEQDVKKTTVTTKPRVGWADNQKLTFNISYADAERNGIEEGSRWKVSLSEDLQQLIFFPDEGGNKMKRRSSGDNLEVSFNNFLGGWPDSFRMKELDCCFGTRTVVFNMRPILFGIPGRDFKLALTRARKDKAPEPAREAQQEELQLDGATPLEALVAPEAAPPAPATKCEAEVVGELDGRVFTLPARHVETLFSVIRMKQGVVSD